MADYSARAAVDIEAPLAVAWSVLTDFASYPTWNPFVHRIDHEGPVGLGTLLHLQVRFSDGTRNAASEEVTLWRPPVAGRAQLDYRLTGRWPRFGLVRAQRSQRLSVRPDGGTRYETVEHMDGLLRHFMPMAEIRHGLQSMADALARAACTRQR